MIIFIDTETIQMEELMEEEKERSERGTEK